MKAHEAVLENLRNLNWWLWGSHLDTLSYVHVNWLQCKNGSVGQQWPGKNLWKGYEKSGNIARMRSSRGPKLNYVQFSQCSWRDHKNMRIKAHEAVLENLRNLNWWLWGSHLDTLSDVHVNWLQCKKGSVGQQWPGKNLWKGDEKSGNIARVRSSRGLKLRQVQFNSVQSVWLERP